MSLKVVLLEFHRGCDFIAPDFKVPAGMTGKVTAAEFGQYGEGNFVQIKFFVNGIVFYSNEFRNKKNYAKYEEKVLHSDIIAEMGSTGDSTGAHIHYEIFSWDISNKEVQALAMQIPSHQAWKRIFFEPLSFIRYIEEKKFNYAKE